MTAGEASFRCKSCGTIYKLSEISKPMNGPLDFVWRASKCPHCGASEMADDGGYKEIWERIDGPSRSKHNLDLGFTVEERDSK